MSFPGDVRSGFRTLVKNPGFTVVAVTMLAVGIGVNATVFTVTDAVLFKGFPLVARNDRLVYISGGGCCISYPDFEDYRDQVKSFQGMAITHGIGVVLSDANGFPENLSVTEVSADTFRLAGQRPILGRDFTPSDEVPGAPPVAILSYGFWQRRYGKDPAILGRAVRMNGAATTFIGVMPQGFSFPQTVDLWVPLVRTAKVLKRENRDTWFAFGRLRDDAAFETARAEVETIGKRIAIAYPQTNQDFRPVVDRFHQFFIGPNAALIYGSMWGAVGFVLLIACANLANLLLARALGRSREISVRIALGAAPWRILRQLLVESLMLSGLGGIAGWWIAKWGVRSYELAMARKSSWLVLDYTMDHRVLAYLVAISLGTGLLFGLAPALRLSRLDINAILKDGGRGATAGGRAQHLSFILVAGEMALAVVLLAGAGVMIRSFLKIHRADMGVNTANVLAGQILLPAARYPGADSQISFFDRLTTRFAAIPGVESVALATSLPSWPTGKRPYELASAPSDADLDELRRPKLAAMVISPGYFHTLGAALLSGRDFNDLDEASGLPVAIVNQRFVEEFWPDRDPLGQRLRFFDGKTPEAWHIVVGVVSNIVQNDQTRQRFDPMVYLPERQEPAAYSWIFLRTRVPPGTLATAFRNDLKAVDPDLPVYGPFELADRLEFFWDSRFYGALFLIFAAIALLLASVGIYTVVSHSVSQRTQEIGIRMAVGATTRDILRLVFQQGMLPLAIGLAIGLAGSVPVNRLLQAELVHISPSDPLTLIVASAALVLSAALGCLIPARRAMRVDPVIALRHE
ncbi:MAG TPA: ABC transporter permease [Bryobacteraceae bacterium]|nr:ABC transporter permease [Bryobacteraceae bacterium]